MTTAIARRYEDMPAQAGPPPAVQAADGVTMDAILTPHRSLKNPAFIILMAVVGVLSLGAGGAFMLMGAWPVLGFFGLDLLLIWFAFRLSYRQGRLSETVFVTPELIVVTRRSPNGAMRHWTLIPAWTQVNIDDPVEHDSQVRVTSHGRTLILGAFLSPEERGDFARAMKDAVARARETRFPGAEED